MIRLIIILGELEMKDELVKVGSLEDCTEYSVCQDCPFGKDCEFEDEYDDGCEDCPCFNNGFDMGFRQGSKIAREELMDDIYIDGYRIGKIDSIKHKVIALGSDKSDKVNEILKDLTDLIKDFAMDAVNEYLCYR